MTTETVTEIFPVFVDYLQPARFKVAYGGRGSGKTRTLVSILTNNVLQGWRVVCFREIMESIADSVYQEFVDEIERRELGAYFTILKTHIECPASGGVIKFSGIKANSKRLDSQKLKGFSGFDCAWLEEANAVSQESWDALIPTMRKASSEIWCSFNPASILEPTYKLFVSERYFPDYDKAGNRYAIIKKINWQDNPLFPKELRDHMEQLKEVDHEAYLHIYEGEPISNDSLAVIKSSWISAAVDAHIKLGLAPTGRKEGGFDVADDGPDCNAIVWRQGVVALGAEEWRDKDPVSASNHAHTRCIELAIELLRYDDIGVGAGAKGQFNQLQAGLLDSGARGFTRVQTEGWTASGEVDNPELEYLPGKLNKNMFLNKKSQGWWLVADRFRHTYNAVNGKPHDKDKLISLSSGMAHLEKLKAELAQPQRDYLNGKVKVESKSDMKKRGVPSPNLADAFIMAFAEGGGVDWSVWG